MTVLPAPTDEVAFALVRLMPEEKFISFLYDDANDLPVKAPVGFATIGYGCNVQAGWSQPFAAKVLRLQVEEVQQVLMQETWYVALNAARRSVMLDIGFNDGIHGLLGFHLMIAAIEISNWQEAAVQCHVKNPKLAGRYSVLAKILLTGVV